jgi:hypothetical protein
MPQDEFDRLIDSCQTNLSKIRLRLSDFEASAAPVAPAFSLSMTPTVSPPPPSYFPAPPPPRAHPPAHPAPPPHAQPPVRPAPSPPRVQPPVNPDPPPQPRPAPKPRPVDAEPAEIEIFPPLASRTRTPRPSTPLWSDRPSSPSAVPAVPPAAPRGTRRRNAAVAAAAAVAAGASYAWLARRPSDITIGVDQADALAVRPDKGDLLVAEGSELVDLARNGSVLQRTPLEPPVTSIRWDQGSLWSADGHTATLRERQDGAARPTVFSLNHVPQSIFVKDKSLWTSDGGRSLRQFLISRSMLGVILQPLDDYALPAGLAPETFAFDDAGKLWLVDAGSRRLYRLRAENGAFIAETSAALSPLLGPVGKIRGLTLDNGSIWLLSAPADGGRGALRRLGLDRLDWKTE